MDNYRIEANQDSTYNLLDGKHRILTAESMQVCNNVMWSLRHPFSGTDEAAEIAASWLAEHEEARPEPRREASEAEQRPQPGNGQAEGG